MVAFVVGAGASLHAGYPLTAHLGNHLHDWARQNDAFMWHGIFEIDEGEQGIKPCVGWGDRDGWPWRWNWGSFVKSTSLRGILRTFKADGSPRFFRKNNFQVKGFMGGIAWPHYRPTVSFIKTRAYSPGLLSQCFVP